MNENEANYKKKEHFSKSKKRNIMNEKNHT